MRSASSSPLYHHRGHCPRLPSHLPHIAQRFSGSRVRPSGPGVLPRPAPRPASTAAGAGQRGRKTEVIRKSLEGAAAVSGMILPGQGKAQGRGQLVGSEADRCTLTTIRPTFPDTRSPSPSPVMERKPSESRRAHRHRDGIKMGESQKKNYYLIQLE
ncbi:hypothetical protein E2C01_053378 [Portunus trituberculatus]|uniref:Uncharacterized protein n=1 Tax=Portunus trituberculatus TaxID=210409 RepID=A0A5B7GP22_PORTR|nr:hypothetical protein [Portunus trituberculatus]